MTLNVTDLTKEIARREALAAAWVASAQKLRGQLDAKARAQYETDGTGVTWTMRDLGRVTLPLTEEAPVISDIGALLKWVKVRHPEHVETVEQVRVAFQSWLLQNVVIADGGVPIDPDSGEVIPGMGVREGGQPKTLAITVSRDAKALYATYAAAEVARQLAAEYGEAVPDADRGDVFLVQRHGQPDEVVEAPFRAVSADLGRLRPVLSGVEWATVDGDTSVIRLHDKPAGVPL